MSPLIQQVPGSGIFYDLKAVFKSDGIIYRYFRGHTGPSCYVVVVVLSLAESCISLFIDTYADAVSLFTDTYGGLRLFTFADTYVLTQIVCKV